MNTGDHLSSMSGKTQDLLKNRKIVQGAAICYRLDTEGRCEVLLLTSRDTERWVIPKGNVERGERPSKCAERESFEEAGIIGKAKKKPLGYYTYLKDEKKPPLVVSVFALKVIEQRSEFPEKGKRRQTWVSAADASSMVQEPELKGLFRLVHWNLNS